MNLSMRRASAREWLSRAGWVHVAMVAIGAAIVVVTFRLLVPAGGDPSKFVVAGTAFADPAETPSSLYVFDSNGYDGQFMWRIAADPTHLKTDHDLGVAIDEPYRLQRVGYPYLAWLLSFGNTSVLVWSLIAVNVLAVGALAGCGAVFARDHGRSPWFGLAVASVPAFAFTLSRDLTELVAAAVLAAGILAATKGRWWLAAALWSYAVLTREQLLIPIAAFAMWRLWTIVRRRSRPDVQDAAWVVPVVAFVAWQMVIWRVDGEFPLFSGSSNLGPPLVGVVGSMGFWASELGHGAKALVTNLLTFYELGFLVVLVVVATRSVVPSQWAWQKWMIVSMAILGVLLTRLSLDAAADFRTLAELSVLAWIVAICWGRRATLVPLVCGQLVGFAGAIGIRLLSI